MSLVGAVGITAANPSDVLKVRFQADASASGRTEAGSLARQGVLRAYATVARCGYGVAAGGGRAAATGVCSGASRVAAPFWAPRECCAAPLPCRAEGVWGGLYKGYAANLMRNSTISTAEIVSYDWTKRAALDSGVPGDWVPC